MSENTKDIIELFACSSLTFIFAESFVIGRVKKGVVEAIGELIRVVTASRQKPFFARPHPIRALILSRAIAQNEAKNTLQKHIAEKLPRTRNL